MRLIRLANLKSRFLHLAPKVRASKAQGAALGREEKVIKAPTERANVYSLQRAPLGLPGRDADLSQGCALGFCSAHLRCLNNVQAHRQCMPSSHTRRSDNTFCPFLDVNS